MDVSAEDLQGACLDETADVARDWSGNTGWREASMSLHDNGIQHIAVNKRASRSRSCE